MKKKWISILLIGLVLIQAGCGGGNGDRVLVAKYINDRDLGPLQRHDVVVFRYPAAPLKGGVPTNYIKRLLGLAGETIAIFFGQLFVTTKLSYPEDQENADPLKLWEPHYMHMDDDSALKLFQEGKFEIIRKPPAVMLSMRRMVYDNNFQPADVKGILPPRWDAAGTGWATPDDKIFTSAGTVQEPDWLHYQHILRPDDWPDQNDPQYNQKKAALKNREHKPHLITDFLAYNSRDLDRLQHSPPQHWVGDLMLEVELKVEKAEGEFWMELAKGVDRFQARWNLADGRCTLYRLNGDKDEEKLTKADTAIKRPGTYQIKFANFDERLTVWVNQSLPFGDGESYERPWKWDVTAEQWVNAGPTLNDLKPASIASKGASVQVSNLKLWRDTYYTTNKFPGRTDVSDGKNLNPVVFGNPDEWESLQQLGVRTMYVQPGHYLCLGDNSPESSDSRDWGLVPERLMLGRALTVYFPFNRIGVIH